MKKITLLLVLLLAVPAFGQKKYNIKPDSPEERMLLEIQGESDAAKRVAMLDDFTRKFASSEALPAAYQVYLNAYLQLQQWDKAIEAGEKAVDAEGPELSLVVNLLRACQAKPDFARVHKWALVAMPVYQKAIATRPPELDDQDWKQRQQSLKQYADFVEYSLFDAATRDATAERLKYLEAFSQFFPQSERMKKLPALYALGYQQANDIPKTLDTPRKRLLPSRKTRRCCCCSERRTPISSTRNSLRPRSTPTAC